MGRQESAFPRLAPGQFNQPSAEQFVRVFEGIFARQYYTESGPLVRQLEAALQSRFGVEHVVCTANASVAWIMLLEAGLERRRVIAPATASRAFMEGSRWTGCELTVCDVAAVEGYRLCADDIDVRLQACGSDCIVAVNPWGGAAQIDGLVELAREGGMRLFFDSSESLGSRYRGRPLGAFGDAEVFSFDPVNILNGAGGACICTGDALLADRIRCMRSSGGVRVQVPVARTVNGRMSEAQAAYAIMGLEALDEYMARNGALHDLYAQRLETLPGLTLLSAAGVSASNYQQAVLAVDARKYGLDRAALVARLRTGGIQARALSFPLGEVGGAVLACEMPGFAMLSETGIELPLGMGCSARSVERICALLGAAPAG